MDSSVNGLYFLDGYFITDACSGCLACKAVCPQDCIDFLAAKAVIRQEDCLHCGNCMNIGPQKAVIREGIGLYKAFFFLNEWYARLHDRNFI